MSKDERTIYLGLGTNLGNLKLNLEQAILHLSQQMEVLRCSSFIESEPWGNQELNPFLNAVIQVKSRMKPFEMLKTVKSIEAQMGREKNKTGQYENRVIDIDVLLFGDTVIDDPILQIPHPLMTEREFVLRPLLELDKNLLHPIHKKRLSFYLKSD